MEQQVIFLFHLALRTESYIVPQFKFWIMIFVSTVFVMWLIIYLLVKFVIKITTNKTSHIVHDITELELETRTWNTQQPCRACSECWLSHYPLFLPEIAATFHMARFIFLHI